MSKIVFAQEEEARLSNVDQAIALLEEEGNPFSFERTFSELQTLSIDEEYRIRQNGVVLQPTEWAFQHFLGVLGIPYRFGKKIPNDLLDIIVSRLRGDGGRVVQLLVRPNNTLINVVPPNYVAPDLVSVLGLLRQTPVKHIRLSNRGTQLLTPSGAIKAEPKQGDIVAVGIALNASETGGPFPYAKLMTYRLVCSNGAVVGNDFGVAKFDRRNRGGLEIFGRNLEDLLQRSEELVPILNSLPERPVSVREFKHLWLQSSRLVGKEAADVLFDVDEERRKELSNAAKARIELETELNSWDVFNALAQCSRDLGHTPGLIMQNIAGQLLQRD